MKANPKADEGGDLGKATGLKKEGVARTFAISKSELIPFANPWGLKCSA